MLKRKRSYQQHEHYLITKLSALNVLKCWRDHIDVKMSQLSKLIDTLFRGQQAIEAYRKLKGDDDR